MGGHKIASTIETRLPAFGIELAKTVTDRDIRTDNEHHVRKPAIALVVNLVEDAPGCQHAHDSRLAGAGRHLTASANEAGVTVRFAVIAGLIARNGDTLQKVGPSLREKDYRLGRFQLSEEKPLTIVATLSSPMLQEFKRSPCNSGIPLLAPSFNPVSN